MFETAFSERLTECPPNCSERYAHQHCAGDGCALFGEGGGGDYGEKISGYVDDNGDGAIACSNPECNELLARACARTYGDSGPLCYECDRECYAQAVEQDLPVVSLQNALEDINGSYESVTLEREAVLLDTRDSVLRDIERSVSRYRRALAVRISQVHCTPLPLAGAA